MMENKIFNHTASSTNKSWKKIEGKTQKFIKEFVEIFQKSLIMAFRNLNKKHENIP